MMRSEDVAVLKDLHLFRDMDASSFQRLVAPSFIQSFPAGTTLLEESRQADFLFVVLDGLVEMSAQAGRGETVIEFLGPVNLFILAAVINDDVCLQSARTLGPSRILMIPASLIRELMVDDPAFMRAVVFELARAYRRTVKELKNQKLRGGASRLANWLLHENERQGAKGCVELAFEKRILAARLGMTPENLSRAFSSLQRFGVSSRGPLITLADVPTLSRFAAPTPLIDEEEPAAPHAREPERFR